MLADVPSLARVDSLDMHNVESDLLALRARRERRPLHRLVLLVESARLRAWERRAGAVVAQLTCCSVADAQRLTRLGVPGAQVAPNGAELPAAPSPVPAASGDGGRVLFVGALDWQPNVEGLRWFLTEVWPKVRAGRPDAVLQVVGRRPGAELTSLAEATPGVQLHADVPSVAPYYDAATVAVCPLLTGGGSRLKIVEAAAFARPVVSTTLGAEGLDGLVGHGVQLREDADGFAELVRDLLADPERAEQVGRRGRQEVEASWSWPSTLAPLAQGLQNWLGQGRS